MPQLATGDQGASDHVISCDEDAAPTAMRLTTLGLWLEKAAEKQVAHVTAKYERY
jgi:hypothetical protein